MRKLPNLSYIIFASFLLAFLAACQDVQHADTPDVELSDFDILKDDGFALSSRQIKDKIASLCKKSTEADIANATTRRHYLNGEGLIWIDRLGVKSQADSLVAFLDKVEEQGLNKGVFRIDQIKDDLKRAKNLDFDEKHKINDVMSRLEFNLTKAYFRYAAGQRFGFVNPLTALNKIQLVGKDTVKVKSKVFNLQLQQPNAEFFNLAIHKVRNDSVADFLRSVQPKSRFYTALLRELGTAKGDYRQKVQVNLERARWRLKDPVEKHDKYVFVNVAEQMLYAVTPDSTMVMKVCCGTVGNKTPLLNSYIKKMELNPVWRMPYSIIKGIAGRAGSSSYFGRRRYNIYDGAGRKVDPSKVTRQQLLSGRYSVVQSSGAGNSLGKIIFRFDNPYAVYLHHTSSPWVFKQQNRCVSHGCVRVERPFDLAVFLLDEGQKDKASDIKYSMDHGTESKDSIDTTRVIKNLPVQPQIPVYLDYFTLYADANNRLREFHDVYGFDKLLYTQLEPLVR